VHGSSYVKYNLWDPICPGHPHEAGGCGGYHSREGFILELRFFNIKGFIERLNWMLLLVWFYLAGVRIA
jgi:hypothetical protein